MRGRRLGPEDDVERIIVSCLERHPTSGAAALARAILETLWEAGYDVTRRSDLIPIRRNSGPQ